MVTQLNPPIPVYVIPKEGAWPGGNGTAILTTDYSQEHFRLYTVGFDHGGQLWDVPQNYVRLQLNPSMQRIRD